MTRFIAQQQGRFSVELMCRTLGGSPSTYYAARNRPPYTRAITDAWLTEQIARVFEDNYGASMGVLMLPLSASTDGRKIGGRG